jgi:Gpi18-like mannosyltransferase
MVTRLFSAVVTAPARRARIGIGGRICWADLGIVLLIFGLSRAAFYVAALFGLALLPRAPQWSGQVELTGAPLLAMHWRWDAVHYYSIALGGYGAAPGTVPTEDPAILAAFFPLFPLLTRGLALAATGWLRPLDEQALAVAGIVISHVATLLAFGLLFMLVLDETDDRPTAQRAVLYAAIFPLAFFYALPYAEPLFLATSLGAFLFARRGYWIAAGLCAALASAARPLGILVLPALALEVLLAWRRGELPRSLLPRTLLGIALAPAGLLLFMLHLWQQVGDPLAFVHAQQIVWHREPVFPLTTLWRGLHYVLHPSLSNSAETYGRTLLHAAIVWGSLLCMLVSLRRWRPAFGLYAALLFVQVLAVPWPGATIMHSLGRSIMVCFPLYLSLARWGRYPAVHHAIVLLWLPLYGLHTALYVCWYFVS